jgi:hypothetical protein
VDLFQGKWPSIIDMYQYDQGCGGAPPPLEPTPEVHSEGERSGSTLLSALHERSHLKVKFGSMLPQVKK